MYPYRIICNYNVLLCLITLHTFTKVNPILANSIMQAFKVTAYIKTGRKQIFTRFGEIG